VRNNRDGTVEAVLEGPAARVESLVAWCGRGPHGAIVEGIEVTREEPAGLVGFETM
jgi:acylphosphatase